MKKFLLFLGLIIIGFSGQSQVLISLLLGDKLNSEGMEFGLEGGVDFTNISGFEDTKRMPKFNLGFYFDLRLKSHLYLYTGVQMKSGFGMKNLSENDLLFLGAKLEEEEGKYSQHVNTFMIPILANYKFDNHFYVEAGPQLGLIYQGWIQFNSNIDNKEIRIKDYNDNLLNWFNAGLAVGTGYKLLKGKGWTIGVRYYQGLTDVFKNKSGTIHNSFHLKVNIPIGAGKLDENG